MTTPDPVTALGYVDPPPPGVLDAARETLWSAITREMLTTDPSDDQSVPQTARHPSPEPRARRRQSGPPDPGS